MSDDALIRFVGAGMREALASYYRHHGSDFGYRMARRLIVEAASEVAQAHSVEDASELCFRIGDKMAVGLMGLAVMPGEELMPGPKHALERVEAAAAVPAITFDFEADQVILSGIEPVEARQRLSRAIRGLDALIPPEPLPPLWRRAVKFVASLNRGEFWLGLLIGLAIGNAQ